MIDNLGGRLGSFDRLERELPAGEAWSSFDRALSGSAYFGQNAPPEQSPPELRLTPLRGQWGAKRTVQRCILLTSPWAASTQCRSLSGSPPLT